MTDTRFRLFLKLGGSLITDKRAPEAARIDVIQRLAREIAQVRQECADLELVLGHGSGSFGHVVGLRYGTRAGVNDAEGWYGFAATADAAARLNRIVLAALLAAGVPAWTISPGAFLRAEDGRIVEGADAAVALALESGLVPVVHGDVALDQVRGGTIVSTEEVFRHLARTLQPESMLLLGEIDGIYTADPRQESAAVPIAQITKADVAAVRAGLGGSHGVDVTGGMLAKVDHALVMIDENPGLEILVAGGLADQSLVAAVRTLRARRGGIVEPGLGTVITG